MAKSYTLDGKRYSIHPHIPIQQISWLIAREHVSVTDDEIRDNIRKRATSAGWTPSIVENAANYAVYCHRKNQGLYRKVMD